MSMSVEKDVQTVHCNVHYMYATHMEHMGKNPSPFYGIEPMTFCTQ